MTGAEFALFTFSMMPDPKASPTTRRSRIAWGLSIAILDGVMRYMEIRYSMFYALFIHTAALPVLHWLSERRGTREAEPWKIRQIMLPLVTRPRRSPVALPEDATATRDTPAG